MRNLNLFFLILIFAIGCKSKEQRASVNSKNQNLSIKTKSDLNASNKDTLRANNDSTLVLLKDVKKLSLPLGSKIIQDYKFPQSFGIPINYDKLDDNSFKDTASKNYSLVFKNNLAYTKLNGLTFKDVTYKSSTPDVEIRQKDSLVSNLKVLGKINYNDFTVFLIRTPNDFIFSNFTSVFLKVVDKEQNITDSLEVMSYVSQGYLKNSMFFYINQDFVITTKEFEYLEGEVSSFEEKKYRLSSQGKFIK